PGGWRLAGPLLDPRLARVWGPDRQLPPDRADAGRYLDLLRCGARPRLAPHHRHGWAAAPARHRPPMVRRLARPLGGRYARHRREQLQREDRLSGGAREPAPARALDPDRTERA